MPSIQPRKSSGVLAPESQIPEIRRLISAEIAHDFNNLLTTILLYSDLLIAALQSDTRLRRHAEAIRKAGTNGVSLVKDLRRPSREKGDATPPMSWNEVVSDLRSFIIRFMGGNIEIQTRLADRLGYVEIDASRAQQIILNLVSNARDAMPKGGKLTISTRNAAARFRNSAHKSQPVSCVEFAVTDTGIGMDENTLSRAFRPFFTTKTLSQGTGIGLTMVHDIVKKGGGEVAIKTKLGKGTRVIVRMPRITCREAIQQIDRPRRAASPHLTAQGHTKSTEAYIHEVVDSKE